MDLGEPLLDRHGLAVRAGGHVTARQHAGQHVRCRSELGTQDVGESAFAGFDEGAGVMGDQPAQQGVGILGVAQVPGAIELVEAREGKAGGVADVVQPSGGFQQVGVRAEPGRGPVRRRPGRGTSGGEGAPAGVSGPVVRPGKPACLCGLG